MCPIPATSGILRSSIYDMQVGDYIPFRWTALTSGIVGFPSELGTCTVTEITTAGYDIPTIDGKAFLLKADKGLLIGDRTVQTNISWNNLNAAGYIEGKIYTFSSKQILLRSLSGGCSYSDVNGEKSSSNQGKGGWPTINEWDTYIIKSDLGGKIIPAADNVWNANTRYSFTKDTPILGIAASSNRVVRVSNSFVNIDCGYLAANMGYRPVLEFKEDGSGVW